MRSFDELGYLIQLITYRKKYNIQKNKKYEKHGRRKTGSSYRFPLWGNTGLIMNHIRYTTVTEYPKFPLASIKHASIKEYISLEQIAVKFEVPTE